MGIETVKQFTKRIERELKMKAYILRGPSGVGKSTWARRLKKYGAEGVSADDFFGAGGSYSFDPEFLAEAHQKCLRNWIGLCQKHNALIVCDNTNTTIGEFAPYVAVAQAYGYHVEVVTLMCDPEVTHARNVHEVKLETVKAQYQRIVEENDRFPRWWRHTIVQTS